MLNAPEPVGVVVVVAKVDEAADEAVDEPEDETVDDPLDELLEVDTFFCRISETVVPKVG